MKPKLLDLFCCDGGAAAGYQLVGFDVTGIDIENHSKRYPGRFIQGDALEYLALHGHEYDAIHASPPCQFACALRSMPNCRDREYHNWIPATRTLLRRSGKPYVIENVEQAKKHLIEPLMLCGTMFDLRTKCGAQLRRHRLFEMNFLVMRGLVCQHWNGDTVSVAGGRAMNCKEYRLDKRMPEQFERRSRSSETISVHGDHPRYGAACSDRKKTITVTGHGDGISTRDDLGGRIITIASHGADGSNAGLDGRNKPRTMSVTGSTPQTNVERNKIRETFTVQDARDAMETPWMTMAGMSQAIPPAYTHWLGLRLMEQL